MTQQLKIILVALSISLIFTYLAPSAGAQAPALAPGQARPPRPPQAQMDQTTNIPYYTLRDGMSSTLTLNNIGPAPTEVTVTIFNMAGRPHTLDPMTLDLHSFKEVRLQDVVPPEDFDSGNIEVAYHGIMMGVTAQVSVVSTDKRVSFESREEDMMDFESSTMNGIIWLPQAEANGFLAVTNTAKNRVTVRLTVGSKENVISLFSRETKLLKLNAELDEKPPMAALVKLQHTGLPGDVLATGFVFNLDNGYSSSFAMLDPAIMRSNHLSGTHFRFGKPDPGEGFPEGVEFRSPLLLANVGDKPTTAHVSVDYTMQEKFKMTRLDAKDAMVPRNFITVDDRFDTVAIKTLTLAPGEVHKIELSEELEKHGVTTPAEETGIDIDYDGAPGTVMGHLTSVDQSGDYSFEVPIKDPTEIGEAIESAYPWTIEKGMSTVLHLKNTTQDSVSADLIFDLPGGKSYNPFPIQLKPYQSVAIDIQKLKDSNTADAQGRTFPADATHGLVFWHQDLPYSMIGRAEGTDISEGIAKSFSCNTGCCDNFWVEYFINPYPMTGLVGSGGSFAPGKLGTDCSGNGFDYNPWIFQPSSWTSDNTAVATVNSSGYTSCVGRGLCTVTANYSDKTYYYNSNYTRCLFNTVSMPAPSPVNVNPPDHIIVMNDSNGPPGICPTKPWVRQTTVQLADVNNAPVQMNYMTSEGYNPQTPTDSCPPYKSPIASGCGVTTTGYCPTCTGAWTDQQDVAGATVAAICGTTIPQTPTCGFALTSTWYMCGTSMLTNSVWSSSRGTYSDRIYLSGSLATFPTGTVFH